MTRWVCGWEVGAGEGIMQSTKYRAQSPALLGIKRLKGTERPVPARTFAVELIHLLRAQAHWRDAPSPHALRHAVLDDLLPLADYLRVRVLGHARRMSDNRPGFPSSAGSGLRGQPAYHATCPPD